MVTLQIASKLSSIPCRFSFACEREDGFSDCFTRDGGFFTGRQEGSVWHVDASRLVAADPQER